MSTGDCSAEAGVKNIGRCSPWIWPLAYLEEFCSHKSMLWDKIVTDLNIKILIAEARLEVLYRRQQRDGVRYSR